MPNKNLMREIAKMIDHSLRHPTLTDAELGEGCVVARRDDVASVCINPYVVALATELLAGSDRSAGAVLVGTVVGFPAGNSTTAIKVGETIMEDTYRRYGILSPDTPLADSRNEKGY